MSNLSANLAANAAGTTVATTTASATGGAAATTTTAATTGTAGAYDDMLGDLLTKSMTVTPDDADAGAAGPGDGSGAGTATTVEAAQGATPGEGEAAGTAAPLAKSFTVKGEDGEDLVLTDASELLKSMSLELDARHAEQGGVNEKLITVCKNLVGRIAKLEGENHSMRKSLTAFGGQGAGRRAAIAVSMPAAAAATATGTQTGAAAAGISGEEFMAKCLNAQEKGFLDATDVASAENHIRKRMQPPAHIREAVARVSA